MGEGKETGFVGMRERNLKEIIEVQLTYNITLVSDVQYNDSICVYIVKQS